MSNSDKQLNHTNWWGPIWRGLVADPEAKHYRSMRSALWLFLYFVVHPNRKTGHLYRRYETIARETGVPKRTIRLWLSRLEKAGYVQVERLARTITITIR